MDIPKFKTQKNNTESCLLEMTDAEDKKNLAKPAYFEAILDVFTPNINY